MGNDLGGVEGFEGVQVQVADRHPCAGGGPPGPEQQSVMNPRLARAVQGEGDLIRLDPRFDPRVRVSGGEQDAEQHQRGGKLSMKWEHVELVEPQHAVWGQETR